MDRSLAARLPLTRAPGAHALRFPRVRPIAIVLLVLALALAAGGWLWFRSSAFVAVQQVRILGVSGREAVAIDGALRSAALRMSTLDASTHELQSAAAGFPLVRAVSMETSFPHAMTITVQERRPVAALVAAGARTAVAGDGVVLGEALLSSSLPVIYGPTLLPRTGAQLHSAALRDDLTVLIAAPRALAPFIAAVYEGPEGLTVKMRNGLLVYFGDDSRPHAKWLSLASVLADESSSGASYIDVRLPERPAAGTDTATPAASGEGASGEALSLAESLDRAVNGGLASQPTTAAVTEPSSAATAEAEVPASESPTSESPTSEVSETEAPPTDVSETEVPSSERASG